MMDEKKKWEGVGAIGFILLIFGAVGSYNSLWIQTTQTESVIRLLLTLVTGIPGLIIISYSALKVRGLK